MYRTSALLFLQLVTLGEGARVKRDMLLSDAEGECARYNTFTFTSNKVPVVFDFSKGYQQGENVTMPMECPSGEDGTCFAECTDPTVEKNGGWTFPSCACAAPASDTGAGCARYKPFTFTSNNVPVVFDFSKGYQQGEKVTMPMECPSGKDGTCIAECTDPTVEKNGGWTFPSCACAAPTSDTGAGCARYKPFTFTSNNVPVVFDFSKGYQQGEKVTVKCPRGKKGTCTAECTDPTGGKLGGWTFPRCGCGVQ